MKSHLFILFCCGNVLLTSGALAQKQRTLDAARMQRDVEIMEMVLERLLNENAAPFVRLGGHSARGVYLPEFGVLFQVPQTMSSVSYFEFHSPHEDEDAGDGAQPAVSARGMVAPEEPAATAFETELLEFFSRYADAIGQLREDDRIAVYHGAGPELALFFNFPGTVSKQIRAANQELLAWVRKSDLEALQTGKLGAADFKSRVSSVARAERESAASRTGQNEVKMLADILDVALGLPRGEANGIYLDQYGAVLFTRVDFNPAWGWSTESQNSPADEGATLSAPRTIADYLRAAERANHERAKNWQGEYEKFKGKLITTIAEYGHTLRNLRADERLVVVTDLSDAPEAQPRQLVCSIKQQQIEDYHSRKISLEELRQAMRFREN
jgi:hypothetical protein